MDGELKPPGPPAVQLHGELVFEAQALLDRRRYGQARAAVARGLAAFPDSVDLQYLGAFLDYAQDQLPEALQGAERVLRTAPDHYGARRLRAHLLEDLKRLAEAEEMWISLLRDYPEDPSCYGSYAELNLRALQLEKAEALAREGLRHGPDDQTCLYVLALASITRGRGSELDEPALQRLLAAHPENRRTSIALIIALSDRGDNGRALRLAQQLLRAQPDSSQLLEMTRELRRHAHWSMLPLYPMQRWGWGGAITLTVGGMVLLPQVASRLHSPYGTLLTGFWLGYVVYSWVWPTILKKLLQ